MDIARHASRLQGVRALYVTPSHQFPTGAVMKIERRMRLLEWAARSDAWLIEDDYDSEFRLGAGAVPALQGLDDGARTIYVGTLARTLSPNVRLGYVIVPASLREAFRAIKWMTDRGTSPLEQRALGERTAAMLQALDARIPSGFASWQTGTAGAHVFIDLLSTPRRETAALLARAERAGVRAYDGSPYFVHPPARATILCGYATLGAREIERGIARLAFAGTTGEADALPNG